MNYINKGKRDILIFPKFDNIEEIQKIRKIKQKNTPEGIALTIIGEDKEKTVVLMRNSASDQISAFGYKTKRMFDVF